MSSRAELEAALHSAGRAGWFDQLTAGGVARRLRRRDLRRLVRRTGGDLAELAELPDERDDLIAADDAHLIICQTRFEPDARFGTQRYVWFVRDDTERWWRAELTIPVRRWNRLELVDAAA
jgi:hypothetical protein